MDRIKGRPGKLDHVGINADCNVLANGQRVLSQRGIVRALSGGRDRGDLGQYLARLPNASDELTAATAIEFELPNGGTALGRTGEWFVAMLRAYKAAWRAGLLRGSQVKLAMNADRMLDALATVGIAALIPDTSCSVTAGTLLASTTVSY